MLRKNKIAIYAILAIYLIAFPEKSTADENLPEQQPDDVDNGNYDDYLSMNDASLCLRQCQPDQPKICYYKFHLEQYTVMGGACGSCPMVKEDCFKPQCVTADGFERAILTVNRRLPGPSIQVCKGDWIVVDVINQFPDKGTTIHWHGIKQRKTPWMDGVSMLTQCPILPGQTFRYYFQAEEAGTYFWHSHAGLQKVDGVEGCLMVRDFDEDNPLRDLYDFDLPSHRLFIQDWMYTLADARLPGQRTVNVGQSPDNYLVNGLGVQLKLLSNNSTLPANASTPISIFNVSAGKRYRFRLIGGTCLSCPFRITFQNHKMTLINVNGFNPVEPVSGDSLVMSAGERFDVVVNTNQPPAAYWILVEGLGIECLATKQVAVLCYEKATCEPDPSLFSAVSGFDPGYVLNPPISNCTQETLSREICLSQLISLISNSEITEVPDVEVIMPFGFHFFTNEELYDTGTYPTFMVTNVPPEVASLVQNISYSSPPSPPLTQYRDIPPRKFCNEYSCKNAPSVCECTNIQKVPLGGLIEFILYDLGPPDFSLNLSHPFHLHGHDFYLVDQGRFNTVEGRDGVSVSPMFIDDQIKKSEAGRDIGQFVPSMDTITIGTGGFAVVRIIANNPGFWFFHCHFAYHLETGMANVIQVGELSDMIPPPPYFPRCHQFVPPLDVIFSDSDEMFS